MSSILPLIFSLFLVTACGKHSQTSSGSNGSSNSQQITTETILTVVLNEDIAALEKFSLKGGDLNTELKNGRTLFTEACYWGKFKVIAFLVAKKVDPSVKDRFAKSPLEYAEEDIKIKRALFPELVVEQQKKLFEAAKSNNMTELKKILEENPPVNFYLTETGLEEETFLTFCVKNKLENVLRFLAQPKYELDVNMKNARGESPLQISKELGYKNIEKLLVKLGALE